MTLTIRDAKAIKQMWKFEEKKKHARANRTRYLLRGIPEP